MERTAASLPEFFAARGAGMIRGLGKTMAGVLFAGALFSAPAVQAQQPGGPVKMQKWATCLEAVVQLQQEMNQLLPRPALPPTQDQSIAAQDSNEATPESLAAAGALQPTTGAWGALNEAMNLQAAGNEAGCFQAVQKARSLAGL